MPAPALLALLGAHAAGSSFDPTSVTGLVAWHDASNAGSITASGGTVSQWDDLSGNGHHLTQATSTYQPTTGSSTINGLNALGFDGVDDYLRSSLTTGTTFIWFLVLNLLDISNGYSSLMDGTGGGARGHVWKGGTTWNMENGSSVGTTAPLSTGVRLYSALFNGASSNIEIDSVRSSDVNPGSNSMNGITLLADRSPDSATFVGADVGELLLYDGAMSDADRASVSAYLKAKWGTP